MSFTLMTSRRDFLSKGVGFLGLGAVIPNFLVRTALAGPEARPDDTILVVVQLSGGNDGLSTVVPYGHDEYGRARQASRIPANVVLKLNDEVGLHPSLTGFKELYDQGRLAVVQGVGYPNPNQSHFTSMDIWHTADPSVQNRSNQPGEMFGYGWIGKFCDHAYPNQADVKRAVALGSARAPRAIQGKAHAGLSLQGSTGFRFVVGDPRDRTRADLMQKLARIAPAVPTAPNNELDFVTQTITGAIAAGEEISNVAQRYQTPTNYPFTSPLALPLRTVAALIAGGLNTRVYYVFQDGYDTHADQKPRHDKLMTDLGGAITAFQQDLARQGNSKRVLLLTFSEFGRRVHENGSRGTDHGTAAPMFLIGPGVKAGVHGKHPSLAKDDLLLSRDLKFHTDFRSVYATVLEKWLRTPSQPVLGASLPLLDCLT